MSDQKMPKKHNSGLLKPATAVEDFLDTLLQESTEKEEPEKPLKEKKKLLLMPDRELKATDSAKPQQELKSKVEERDTAKTSSEPKQLDESAGSNAIKREYQFPLQCLMFTVAGNQLSIPLIQLGSVLNWGERLTLLPDTPDWFLGILQHRDIQIKVADTANIIQIKLNDEHHSDTRHILVFGDDNWAITCDRLGDVVNLEEDDVKWSRTQGKNFSLGTIKQSLAVLLDPDMILKQLNRHGNKENE